MSFAPLGRVLVVIFGTLGLAIQARMLFSHPEEWNDIAAVWMWASITEKLLIVVHFLAPVWFYSFCITTCFVRPPKRLLVTLTVLTAFASLPVFLSLHSHYPTVTKNALWTAVCWSFVFAELYTQRHPDRDSAPDSDTSQESKPDTET